MTAPRLLFLVTEDSYFCSHRLPLATGMREAGFDVTVATRVSDRADLIRGRGLHLEPIGMSRSGRDPLRDLGTIVELVSLYRRIRPDIVHHVAMKPVLYGTLAARIARVPVVVNALAGLGYVFTSGEPLARILRPSIEWGLRAALRGTRVILQNRDDLAMLAGRGVVRESATTLIRGSGVDLREFSPVPEPPGTPVVVLPARLLRDKGVTEFVAAARIVRSSGVPARFVLAGRPDPANPSSITEAELSAWQREGAVEAWGWRTDMAAVFASSHVVCLPSYREGLPKALIEAAAAGRPIVTCDVPGCREVVTHESNGLLVTARSVEPLAAALTRLVSDAPLRRTMGAAGRVRAETEFGIGAVIEQTLRLYRVALGRS